MVARFGECSAPLRLINGLKARHAQRYGQTEVLFEDVFSSEITARRGHTVLQLREYVQGVLMPDSKLLAMIERRREAL